MFESRDNQLNSQILTLYLLVVYQLEYYSFLYFQAFLVFIFDQSRVWHFSGRWHLEILPIRSIYSRKRRLCNIKYITIWGECLVPRSVPHMRNIPEWRSETRNMYTTNWFQVLGDKPQRLVTVVTSSFKSWSIVVFGLKTVLFCFISLMYGITLYKFWLWLWRDVCVCSIEIVIWISAFWLTLPNVITILTEAQQKSTRKRKQWE
jgi:hypothetical protein